MDDNKALVLCVVSFKEGEGVSPKDSSSPDFQLAPPRSKLSMVDTL